MITRRRALAGAAYGFSAAAWPQAADLVRIINGFPAGGTADSMSRRVAERLAGTPYTRQAAVVENRVGAGGRIACEAVKNAPPDGSVLLLTPYSCTAIYPHIYARLSYDPVRDLAPVSIAGTMSMALTVGPLVPEAVRSVKDYLAWAKANPDKANYGSPAAGSIPHFLGALLGLNSAVELKHIPYRGSAPAIVDLLGGQISATSTPVGDALANYRAGRLRILATSGPRRSLFTPDVPTYAEQGFVGLTTEEWFGFYAPARTPATTVALANAAINAALKEASVIDALAVIGLVAAGSSPLEMQRSQQEAFERWGPLVKRIGFTGES